MVNRTKCNGINEKCAFAWKSLSSRYLEQLKCFFLAIIVLQVLFLNFKLAFERM